MSNSRLEKFIYAICGMDIDDLPTPLSRIETLWNCLITGETPDFEPLSRNEKYLMAMIGQYDISNLPEPTSRSEKLLYKIATGETDLTDVPGYLSRYEELLKHLIENGGIGGTDFEYVLYTLNRPLSTLYTTAEAPVKSAILSGNTLVNLFDVNLVEFTNEKTTVDDGVITIPFINHKYNNFQIPKNKCTMFKPSTTYTLIVDMIENSGQKQDEETEMSSSFCLISYSYSNSIVKSSSEGLYACRIPHRITGKFMATFTTHDINEYNQKSIGLSFSLGSYYNATGGQQKFSIVILEGDYTNVDIPYFEGMQSVKMPVLKTMNTNFFNVKPGDLIFGRMDNGVSIPTNKYGVILREDLFLDAIPNKYCWFFPTSTYGSNPETFFYDENYNYIKKVNQYTLIPENARYMKFTYPTKQIATENDINLLLNEGRIGYFDSWNPHPQYNDIPIHKTNILTTTSKNLFDMNRPYDNLTDSQATVVQDTNQITVSSAESGIYVNANFILDKDFFAGKTVTGSCLYESDENDIGTVQITYQDGDGEYHYQWIRTPRTFTFPNSFIGDVMLSISANNTGTPQSNTVTVKNIQLELGSTATPYEPYSEVVLRGIGDVKDTLDGNTGELTQRIGEVVLDGSEDWVIHQGSKFKMVLAFPAKNHSGTINCISDKLPSRTYGESIILKNIEGVSVSDKNLGVNKAEYSENLNGFKEWLSENPMKVQYILETPTVKTVVLSTLDQDGQPTKLKTFNDITHVSIEAEDLLPTVDLEVPTKIEETLSTLPTLMNDISETQQLLNESIDNQAENINEVSTAMAEIHNDIL